jgi:hypothetical protein
MARATGMYEMVSKNKDTRFRLPFNLLQNVIKRSPPGCLGVCPTSKYFLQMEDPGETQARPGGRPSNTRPGGTHKQT